MPAIIVETFESGGATVGPDSPGVDLKFAVLGTEIDIEVRALVEGTIPAIFRGMVFKNYRIDHKGGGVWDVSVRYGQDDTESDEADPGGPPAQPGDQLGPSYTFETSGGKQHITQSLETISKHGKPGVNPPDFKGANLKVGDIQNINKKGWEYLWVRYGDVEDQKVLIKQPEAAYVERVYEPGTPPPLPLRVPLESHPLVRALRQWQPGGARCS